MHNVTHSCFFKTLLTRNEFMKTFIKEIFDKGVQKSVFDKSPAFVGFLLPILAQNTTHLLVFATLHDQCLVFITFTAIRIKKSVAYIRV
jgi:hypothetical protein